MNNDSHKSKYLLEQKTLLARYFFAVVIFLFWYPLFFKQRATHRMHYDKTKRRMENEMITNAFKQFLENYTSIFKRHFNVWRQYPKRIVIVLLTCCLSSNIVAQNFSELRTGDMELRRTNVTLQFPENILPSPYSNSVQSQMFGIEVYTGKVYRDKLNGFAYMNPANNIEKNGVFKIQSMQYYQNANLRRIENHESGRILIYTPEMSELNIAAYFYPFYMKQLHVTNAEYRSFIYWVRDSIARTLLANSGNTQYMKTTDNNGSLLKEPHLNHNIAIDWKNIALNEMFVNFEYEGRSSRARKLNVNKLKYKYINKEKDTLDIAIYPDTTLYVDAYSTAKNKEFVNYLWRPEFDQCPVMGITWVEQAKAFCHWRARTIHKFVDFENITFEVEVGLPKTYEWEFVLSGYKTDKPAKKGTWILDLMDYRILNEYYKQEQTNRKVIPGAITLNYYTRKKILEQSDHVYFLGDFANEWLSETFEENWIDYFKLRASLISVPDIVELNILNNIEQRMNEIVENERTTHKQHLIYGPNIYNTSYIEKGLGEFNNSSYGKTFAEYFLAGNTTFRYVIRFKPVLQD